MVPTIILKDTTENRLQQTMTPSQPDPEASATSSSTSINRHENSNPLLDQALRKHIESLQPEDRAAFEHCTAEEVIAAAERLSSAHAAQSRTRRYLARFVDIVKPLESYFDLVGNVVGSLPAGAQLGGIVWGALRFVIKVWQHVTFPPSLVLVSLDAHPAAMKLNDRQSTCYRTTLSESWESWRGLRSPCLSTKIMLLRSIASPLAYSK